MSKGPTTDASIDDKLSRTIFSSLSNEGIESGRAWVNSVAEYYQGKRHDDHTRPSTVQLDEMFDRVHDIIKSFDGAGLKIKGDVPASNLWKGYRQEYKDIQMESRKFATNGMVACQDFVEIYLPIYKDPEISSEERVLHFKSFEESLVDGEQTATTLLGKCNDLGSEIKSFRQNILESYRSEGRKAKGLTKECEEYLTKIEGELEATNNGIRNKIIGSSFFAILGAIFKFALGRLEDLAKLVDWLASVISQVPTAMASIAIALAAAILYPLLRTKPELEYDIKLKKINLKALGSLAERIEELRPKMEEAADKIMTISEEIAVISKVFDKLRASYDELLKNIEPTIKSTKMTPLVRDMKVTRSTELYRNLGQELRKCADGLGLSKDTMQMLSPREVEEGS